MGSKSKHDTNSEKSKSYPDHSTPVQHHKKSKKKKDLNKQKDIEDDNRHTLPAPKVELTPSKSSLKKLKGRELYDSTYKVKHTDLTPTKESNQGKLVSIDHEKEHKKEPKSSKKRKSIFESPQPQVKESGNLSENSVYSTDALVSPKKKKKKHKKNKEENASSDVHEVSKMPSPQNNRSLLRKKNKEPTAVESEHSSCEDEFEQLEHATAQQALNSNNEDNTEKDGSNKYNTECFEGWTKTELFELVNRMLKAIPKNDTLKHNSRVEKLDWDQVKFEQYSAEECKEKWKVIEKRLRGYRLLEELLSDAKEWIEQPWTDFYRSVKKNRHPDLPKRPLTSYMLFYMDKKEKYAKKYPGLEMTNLSKLIATKYKQLTTEKREKYNALALNMREEYKEKMQKFVQDHPRQALRLTKNAAGGGNKKGTSGMPGPAKPITPFKIFLEDKVKQHQSDPGFNVAAFTAGCKLMWKALSRKKKIPWIRWAHEGEVKYLEEIKLYKSENPSFEVPPYKSVLSKEEKAILDRTEGKPDKPPYSAYSLFSRIMLKDPKLKAKYDTPKERLTEIARLWKKLPKVDRDMYAEEVKRLLDKYKMEYATYLDSLPEERREEELASNIPKRKTKGELQKNSNNNNNNEGNQMKIDELIKKSTTATKGSVSNEDIFLKEPLPPPSDPFILFQNEVTKSSEMSDKKLRKAWLDLSDKEKEKYSVKLQELKQQYFIDYRAFLTSLKPDELKTYSARKGNPVANKPVAKDSESEGSVDSEASSSSSDDNDSEEEEEDVAHNNNNNNSDDDDEEDDSEEEEEKVRQIPQSSKKEESSDSDSSDSDSGSMMKLKLN